MLSLRCDWGDWCDEVSGFGLLFVGDFGLIRSSHKRDAPANQRRAVHFYDFGLRGIIGFGGRALSAPVAELRHHEMSRVTVTQQNASTKIMNAVLYLVTFIAGIVVDSAVAQRSRIGPGLLARTGRVATHRNGGHGLRHSIFHQSFIFESKESRLSSLFASFALLECNKRAGGVTCGCNDRRSVRSRESVPALKNRWHSPCYNWRGS